MTDREKLIGLINGCNLNSFEAILDYFLEVYGDEINIRRIRSMMNTLNYHLAYKIDNLEHARFVANERAGYIKKYLKGEMWQDEEIAKMYLQPQIDNAQAIIDACKC